jgi:hypothetical protein
MKTRLEVLRFLKQRIEQYQPETTVAPQKVKNGAFFSQPCEDTSETCSA